MGNMNMMGGTSMPQGFNPNMGMNPNMASAGMGGGFPQQVALPPNLAAQQAQAQRNYQQRLQQQILQSNFAAQHQRMQAAGMNPAMMPGGQHPNMSTPTRPGAVNPQQQQQQAQAFINKVAQFMQQSGRPFDPNPMVSGRPVNLYALFTLVLRAHGSKMVTMKNQWASLARLLNLPEAQFPQIGMEIKTIFERNLGLWEAAYLQQQQAQKAKMESMQQQMGGGMTGLQQPSPAKPMPHTPQPNQIQQQYMQQLQQRMQQSQVPSTPAQNNVPLPTANGFSTPTPDLDPAKQHLVNQHRKSASRQIDASPASQQPAFPTPSPVPGAKPETQPGAVKTVNGVSVTTAAEKEEPPEPSTNYKPNVTKLDFWGGVAVEQTSGLGEKISMLKPIVPDIAEMGIIDLRALSLSLESGIHAETRYALDYLVKLSVHPNVIIELEQSEDLLDTILDCAEAQMELLEHRSPEVSDVIDLNNYEHVVRDVKKEINGLQNIAEAGTPEYDLDRAADRLVAVTTILRNFSFMEKNQAVLAGNRVIKLISNAIRLLGTRSTFLRSHNNVQDFMKDLVTLLSNVSDKISLPSREDALNILHFLLAFAPSPPPTASKTVRFTFYDPRVHRYYPPAIDSLAKLLARDDPNKNHYKHLFTDNVPSPSAANLPVHQQYDLLTRAFAFAVAIIPDRTAPSYKTGPREKMVAEARKASLTQGMLAADILLTLTPAAETGLAKAWTESEDGWAPSLLRLLSVLSMANRAPGAPGQNIRGPAGRGFPQNPHLPPHLQAQREEVGFEMVVRRGFDVIRRLQEMAREGRSVGGEGKEREDSADVRVNGEKDEAQKSVPQYDGFDEPVVDEHADKTGKGGDVMDVSSNGVASEELEISEDEDWEKALFWKGVLGEALPKEHAIIGALLTDDADGNVIREMLALSRLDD